MPLSITQTVLLIFLLFALTRVILRFRGSTLSFTGLIFWSAIFGMAMVGVLFPILTSQVANFLGIGRGVDAVIYTSIVLLFYLVFRIYIYIEDLRREITELVKKIALKETDGKKVSKD